MHGNVEAETAVQGCMGREDKNLEWTLYVYMTWKLPLKKRVTYMYEGC